MVRVMVVRVALVRADNHLGRLLLLLLLYRWRWWRLHLYLHLVLVMEVVAPSGAGSGRSRGVAVGACMVVLVRSLVDAGTLRLADQVLLLLLLLQEQLRLASLLLL